MSTYCTLRRLERAVEQLARSRGFTGDIFAKHPRFGTHDDHLAIAELELDVQPRPRTDREKRLVHALASAAVLGSQQPRGEHPNTATSGKLARERRRA